jgi:hypothetical protein
VNGPNYRKEVQRAVIIKPNGSVEAKPRGGTDMNSYHESFCICLETEQIGLLPSFNNLKEAAIYYVTQQNNLTLVDQLENETLIPLLAKSLRKNDDGHYLILVDEANAERMYHSLSIERYYRID